ncbi:MAG: MBL fold metallo-hydrolase [Maritimibacter sp.]|nr:MBL fold metallo-hydrolase [Maritimibacter sp.]
MTSKLEIRAHADPAKLGAPEGGFALWWLGQAGFLIEAGGLRLVIDAYLSDSLAEKYRGKKFDHVRMMPLPVAPDALRGIDWLLCTHGHTDHMDPGTIPALVAANPEMRVLVPRAELEKARDRGAPSERLFGVDAGEAYDLDGLTLTATPSAHEELRRSADGNHLFLGYALATDRVTIWHSGDTVPFDGLEEILRGIGIDWTLLPINGRDAERATNGVPGNLTLEEAMALTEAIGAAGMIGHHFGMFAFNTVAAEEAWARVERARAKVTVRLAEVEHLYQISPCDAKK